MEFAHKGSPADAPRGYVPWFTVPRRRHRSTTVVFGHWAALGLYINHNVAGIDTGCVWGRDLTALRLSDGTLFQSSAAAPAQRARSL